MSEAAVETQSGTLRHLAVEKLIALKRNPQYLSERQMEAMKDSMRRDGFLAPVLVRPRDDGTYEVLSGNHRVMAAREIGLEKLPALIVNVDDSQAGRIAVNLNTIHGDPTPELLAPFLAELDDATLSSVHLDADMIASLREFDATLEETLKRLQPPPSLDNDTPTAGSTTPCVCPNCGRHHMKKLDAV